MNQSELPEVAWWAGGITKYAIYMRLAYQLVKVLFFFVRQQKATVVFDVSLAVSAHMKQHFWN